MKSTNVNRMKPPSKIFAIVAGVAVVSVIAIAGLAAAGPAILQGMHSGIGPHMDWYNDPNGQLNDHMMNGGDRYCDTDHQMHGWGMMYNTTAVHQQCVHSGP